MSSCTKDQHRQNEYTRKKLEEGVKKQKNTCTCMSKECRIGRESKNVAKTKEVNKQEGTNKMTLQWVKEKDKLVKRWV